jgi:lipopolysaccharide assembly protein A
MTTSSASPGTPAEPGAGVPAETPPAVEAPAAPAPVPVPTPAAPAAPAAMRQHRIKHTRISGAWTAAVLFALVLLLLLIFILENGQKVKVTFFGATGHLPLGVALLLAAVLGILLVVVPGTARIVQLRITARRHRKADATAAAPVPPAPASPADPSHA